MKTLILLGGGTEAIPIIRRVRDLGYRAVVVDGNAQCAARAMVDDFVHASCYEGNYAVKMLKLTADAWQLRYDGVLCAAVDAPVVAAEVAAAFGLPGLSIETARLSSNKLAQKWVLRRADIPVPPFAFWADATGYILSTEPITNPVVKPVDSRGGRGVVRLLPGVDAVWAYEQAKAHSLTGRVMVEQWLDGPQLSTESIVQDGRVLFTAVGLRNYSRLDEFAPFVVEDGAEMPYGDDALMRECSDVVEASCRALGWDNLTVKGDLVIHGGRMFVIEVAARLSGGFFSSHYIPGAHGVDFVGDAIKLALGYKLESPRPYTRGAVCQRYVFPGKNDIGKVVVNVPNPNQFDAFSTWNISPGKTIEAITSHPSRWGQVTVSRSSIDRARHDAEEIVQQMKSGVVLTD